MRPVPMRSSSQLLQSARYPRFYITDATRCATRFAKVSLACMQRGSAGQQAQPCCRDRKVSTPTIVGVADPSTRRLRHHARSQVGTASIAHPCVCHGGSCTRPAATWASGSTLALHGVHQERHARCAACLGSPRGCRNANCPADQRRRWHAVSSPSHFTIVLAARRQLSSTRC
jgi:hypothetical protein